jgi:hypothetical protein
VNFDSIPIPPVYAHADEIEAFLVYLAVMTLGAYAARQLVSLKGGFLEGFSIYRALFAQWFDCDSHNWSSLIL